MEEIKFEWDKKKSTINIEKHGVSFEEATTVFNDINAVLFDDPDHSGNEERFILLGMSTKANLLIVCHCIRSAETIRIISARRATKRESEQYLEIQKGW